MIPIKQNQSCEKFGNTFQFNIIIILQFLLLKFQTARLTLIDKKALFSTNCVMMTLVKKNYRIN